MSKLLHKNLTEKIIGVYYRIYNGLSHTYPEYIYENAFAQQLRKKGFKVFRQEEYLIKYKEKLVGMQRLDLFAADEIVIELKVAPNLQRIHKAQAYSYLKTVGKEIGFLFNFGGSEPQFKRLYFDMEKDEADWQPQQIPVPDNPDLIYPNLVNQILNVSTEVYHGLGPGFIHRIYANACYHECLLQGISAIPHRQFYVIYKNEKVGEIKFNHLAVADKVLFFPVAIQNIRDIHLHNIKAWLQHCDMKIAVLVNFFGAKLQYVVVRV